MSCVEENRIEISRSCHRFFLCLGVGLLELMSSSTPASQLTHGVSLQRPRDAECPWARHPLSLSTMPALQPTHEVSYAHSCRVFLECPPTLFSTMPTHAVSRSSPPHAHPQSLPTVPPTQSPYCVHPRRLLTVPIHKAFLHRVPAVPTRAFALQCPPMLLTHGVSLQCPLTKSPYTVHLHSLLTVPRRFHTSFPTVPARSSTESPCNAHPLTESFYNATVPSHGIFCTLPSNGGSRSECPSRSYGKCAACL